MNSSKSSETFFRSHLSKLPPSRVP